MNRNKVKGSSFERDVVVLLREAGFRRAARTLAGSSDDRGDISGVPGWVFECKNTKRISLPAAFREAEVEAKNHHCKKFCLINKRQQRVADEAYATIPLWLLVDLIKKSRRK